MDKLYIELLGTATAKSTEASGLLVDIDVIWAACIGDQCTDDRSPYRRASEVTSIDVHGLFFEVALQKQLHITDLRDKWGGGTGTSRDPGPIYTHGGPTGTNTKVDPRALTYTPSACHVPALILPCSNSGLEHVKDIRRGCPYRQASPSQHWNKTA